MHHYSYIQNSKALKLTLLSLFISILIFGFKLLAFFITKSVAIYSDAMESIINIVSATIALLGTKIALKPPDEEHPYGYTKFEYFISICEASFIIGVSISIFWKAYQSFLYPKSFENLSTGFIIILITILLNSALSYFIYKQGKKENSPILISHAYHIFTDIITTGGVIAGVYIAQLSKLWIIDPIIASLISINILYFGYKIIKNSVSSLLDASLPQEKVTSIQNIIENTIKNFSHKDYKIHDIHDLKTRRAGRKGFIEFHLTVSGNMSVKMAHDLCDELEKKITDKFPELSVTIHIEPEEEKKN